MEQHHYNGLSEAEVTASRARHGENVLTPPQKESLWSQFIGKFTDPIIIILLVALALSVAVAIYQYTEGIHGSDVFLEPVGIFVSVILATMVGFAFEVSANRKFEVLNKVNDDTPVKVIRQGRIMLIVKRDVVVGDIVVLSTGEEVPADGRLLEAVSLQINESTLTGEPIVNKSIDPSEFDPEATYPTDLVMRGTSVVDGHGVMEVTAVGDSTEYGKVYEGSQIDNSVETPLNKQLKRLARMITRGSYAVALLIVAGRMAAYLHGMDGFDWLDLGRHTLDTVMIAITIVVVAVPEGLPMSVTLSLALSMKRMLVANNLVRKMHACETMGATTVICTDKTGTLTQNRMSVFKADFFCLGERGLSSEASGVITEGIAVNSTAFLDLSDPSKATVLGNPTEGALLLWLHDNGVDYLPVRNTTEVIEQLTFSTERKYMATMVRSHVMEGQKVIYVKGAPEIVMSMCGTVLMADGTLAAMSDLKEGIDERLLGYQNRAMRTLGFAYCVVDDDESHIRDGRLHDVSLSLLGIAAISDPVGSDVPQAVADCLGAGIDIKIVTGDTPGTAREIGRQIGLWGPGDTDRNHLTGPDFAALSDDELLARVLSLKIMSRARPMDKQRLVRLLQQKDQVVAVTGDGTNDAPALKAAQVGLSMGDGTSVAKEASDITILDNSFASISRAVMWGRSLYKNIRRFILFQMTINVAACLIVTIGAFLGTESPLTVTQMLWVNLIMDTFAALALASLPPDSNVMKERPRKTSDYIISRAMAKNIIGVGLALVVVLFGVLQYFKHVDITSLSGFSFRQAAACYFDFSQQADGLTPYELSLFFTIFVMLQFWNMFNAKAFSTGTSAFAHIAESKGFMFIALVVLAGQWLIVTFGGKMFGVVPLSLSDWLITIAATSVVLWTGEAMRLLKPKHRHR
ncbi:MAG: calcium-translocating P-type ATPase, PMCA-type [Rikenellaceae bacterium]|nr:calcium-translocating P-type ATPase, PMCA-type [Rikenellaceae bacterium]